MKVIEYGECSKETIIFLHGGGLSWWSYKEIAEHLEKQYHVLIPILDGHAGSDREFISIEENAREIIEYINNTCNGSVLLIGGLSLGAQILLEMLAQRRDICKYAIVESALVIPQRIINGCVKLSVYMSYGLIKKRWFSRLQFYALRMKHEMFEIYYEDTCQISQKSLVAILKANTNYQIKDSVKECNAKVLVLVGKKESNMMIDSAKKIHKLLPKNELKIIEGCYHGDISMKHTLDYVRSVDKMLKNKLLL